MKLIATSDTHFAFSQELIPSGDVFVHAGDFMYSGYPGEWYPILESFRRTPHKHKLLVPGNHDIFFQGFTGPCLQEMREAGVYCLTPTKPKTEIDGVRFGGCPFVTNLPNWAYNADENFIWDYLDDLGRVDVLICHSPPAGILDGKNYGVKAIRKYIHKYEPEVVICGHVHENGGEKRKVGKTQVYNVAMTNTDYQQVTPATVIDLV